MRPCRPHAFKAVYTISLHGEKLRTDLRVINTGDKAFEFTAALHSYFEVLDIGVAKISGLSGLKYLDKVLHALRLPLAAADRDSSRPAFDECYGGLQVVDANNPAEKQEHREVVSLDGPMDSLYLDAPEHVQLDVGTGL